MITVYIFLIVIVATTIHTIIGCITVPMQGAMIIDAIGHSVVAGIIGGFIIGHSLHSIWLFIGAILSAIIMNILIIFLSQNNKITYDASIGISFSFMFSIGILLISIYARNIHLDLDMILLGNIEYAVYDTIKIFNFFIPKILIMLFSALLFLLFLLILFWKKLIAMLFDKEYSKMKGVQYFLISIILISLNSYIIVSSFNAIGALILTGIAVSPFGFSWHGKKSYYSFIASGIFYNLIFAILGCIASLLLNIPIAATVALFTTSGALINIFHGIVKK